MASSMIHIAIASEANKRLKRDKSKLLIGTISPDISKLLGEKKIESHFLDGMDTNIPNLNRFLAKYQRDLDDDFVLGYYIHLFTDYLWFKYFIPELIDGNMITKLDGTKVEYDDETFLKYVYRDYTNLNIKLIDEYNLDLKIFYNDLPRFNNIIDEIPMNKLYLIVNKVSEIVENTKEKKELVFNLSNVNRFIDLSVKLIIANLEELNIV